MKNKLLYLLSLLLVLAVGCGPHYVAPTDSSPEGTYKGLFYLIHITPGTNAIDTISKNNLNLSLETATGFRITGDTSTNHAGSYGTYRVNTATSQIRFYDVTWPLNGISTKIHLDGSYSYNYDGIILQIKGYGARDTLEYYYKFTRIGG
jgi:hypothetical protein